MVPNKQFIYVVCLAIIFVAQMFGCIDLPATFVRTLDDIEYRFNEPEEMDLHVNGIYPQRSTFLGLYRGYDIKTTIANTGRPGYANITCNVYDLNGVLINRRYIYPNPHFERNSNEEFHFSFNSNELPDNEYKFDITIGDQIKDS